MSDYLKDSMIPFHTIGASQLDDINNELKAIIDEVTASGSDDNPLLLIYTLRYDGMGIVRQDFKEIKNCFDRAKSVDRLLFDLVGRKWLPNNKGKRVGLHFDSKDPSRCYIVVQDDDEKWVDNVFKRISSRLSQYKNYNWIIRHPLAELLIQLFGVMIGFFTCLISASHLSPILNIKNSFVLLFIGLFLIFSNLWTYILVVIKKVRDDLWPTVSFKKKPFGLVGQTVVGFIITGILAWLADSAWKILAEASSTVIK
jgi:hypothetical protein